MVTTIGIIGPPTDISGGPSSFRLAFERALRASTVELVGQDQLDRADAILVMGGTRRIATLLKARRRKAEVVVRLDGLPTSHLGSLPATTQLLALARQGLIKATLRNLATKVVFQSQFSLSLWADHGFTGNTPHVIIHNGTNLDYFAPDRSERNDIIVSEGSISGAFGGVELLEGIAPQLAHRRPGLRMNLFGRIESRDRETLARHPNIHVHGPVPRSELARRLSTSQAAISIERMPACPNSVIESLASGTPVVGHALGSMPELVDNTCGRLVAFVGDPQRDLTAEPDSFVTAIIEVLDDHVALGATARRRAEEQFDIRCALERYINFIGNTA